jgi:class 3 adenylate cyclase
MTNCKIEERDIRIACVDDMELSLRYLRFQLIKVGVIKFDFFSSGQDFLDHYLNKGNEPPDLVFLDINLPIKNGLEILEEALQNSKLSQAIFVAITGYLDIGDSKWLGFLGFDLTIEKPITSEIITEIVNSLQTEKQKIIDKRNPYGNLLAAIKELSRLRLRSAVLEENYIKKLISPEVFLALDTDPEKLIPKSREIAVGFVDIRGFTQLMNRLQISQVNEVLKLFFESTVSQINLNSGFVDKFVGDEVMWFHHKGTVEANCKQCINAAISMIQDLKELNKAIQRKLHLKLNLKIGIGIACGNAALGLFGAPNYRIQYSVLGPPVNLASRLCSLAKEGQILIGGEAIEYCDFRTIEVGFQSIKGFDHKVELKRVILTKQP